MGETEKSSEISEADGMSSTRQLLTNHNPADLFTIVYTVTDDYIIQSIRAGRFTLPTMKNQKASYAS